MSKREGGRRDGRRERELSVIGESPAIPPTGIAATSETGDTTQFSLLSRPSTTLPDLLRLPTPSLPSHREPASPSIPNYAKDRHVVADPTVLPTLTAVLTRRLQ